jgi:hypothetical protein
MQESPAQDTKGKIYKTDLSFTILSPMCRHVDYDARVPTCLAANRRLRCLPAVIANEKTSARGLEKWLDVGQLDGPDGYQRL